MCHIIILEIKLKLGTNRNKQIKIHNTNLVSVNVCMQSIPSDTIIRLLLFYSQKYISFHSVIIHSTNLYDGHAFICVYANFLKLFFLAKTHF